MDQQKPLLYGLIIIAGLILAWLSFRSTGEMEIISQSPEPIQITPEPEDISITKKSTENIGRLNADIPNDWIQEKPTSALRLVQYKVPGIENDSESATLVVFNKIGGSVDQNLNRWYGQFLQPDGSDSKNKSRIRIDQVDGMRVTIVALKGTYIASGLGMGGATENKLNYGLLAAIVETPEGPYYFKMVGPEKTIDFWMNPFEEFIRSIQYIN